MLNRPIINHQRKRKVSFSQQVTVIKNDIQDRMTILPSNSLENRIEPVEEETKLEKKLVKSGASKAYLFWAKAKQFLHH